MSLSGLGRLSSSSCPCPCLGLHPALMQVGGHPPEVGFVQVVHLWWQRGAKGHWMSMHDSLRLWLGQSNMCLCGKYLSSLPARCIHHMLA